MTSNLPLPKSGIIRNICHISDIHIRPGTELRDNSTRFTEYATVFTRICSFLRTHKEDDLVICITGDIFHDNKKAGAPCIELFFMLIEMLADIVPIYIIRGNHDYNQASIQDQDMLSAFKKPLDRFKNVAYLADTGHYTAGNVLFGLVAIQDVLKSGNTHGTVNSLPTFPTAATHPDGITKTIALFHGDVPGTYPIEWFGQYDYILLGDLHHMQVHNATAESDNITLTQMGEVYHMNTYAQDKKPLWAYPGSTIQQNHGESIVGHGFLMWNLDNNTIQAFHVPNDYAFVTARLKLDEWYVNLSFPNMYKHYDRLLTLPTINQIEWFPKTLRLRIQSKGLVDNLTVINELQQHGFTMESSKQYIMQTDLPTDVNDTDDIDTCTTNVLDLQQLNKPEAWAVYIQQSVPQTDLTYSDWALWLSSPDTLVIKNIPAVHHVSANIQSYIDERNKKIGAALDDYKRALEHAQTTIVSHTRFEFSYMDWAYILCFTDNCHFNFKTLKKQVHCISGKNGYGKTSFLETMCIALFGEGFPSRTAKHSTGSFICLQKPRNIRSYTSIVFNIDEHQYRLKRVFELQLDNKLHAKEIDLESYDPITTKFVNIQSGKKATTEWINRHVGTVESFLTSCMITQSFDQDFFQKKPTEQKIYLDQQLRLDSSTAFCNLLKTVFLAHDDILKKLNDIIALKMMDKHYQVIDPDAITNTEATLHHTTQRIMELSCERDALQQVWSVVSERILSQGRDSLQAQLVTLDAQLASFTSSTLTIDELNMKKGTISHDLNNLQQYIVQNGNLHILEQDLANHRQKTPHNSKPNETVESLTKHLETTMRELPDNIIADLDAKLAKFKLTYDKTQTKHTLLTQKCSTLQSTLSKLKKSHSKLLQTKADLTKNEPSQPTILEHQYISWCNELQPFQNKYKSFKDLDAKLQLHINNKPTVSRPTLTQNEISNLQSKVTKWLSKLKLSTGITDPSSLSDFVQDKAQAVTKSDTQMRQLNDAINLHNESILTINSEHTLVSNSLRSVLEAMPPKPTFNEKEKKAELAAIKKLNTQLTKLRSSLNGFSDTQLHAIVEHLPTWHLSLQNIEQNIKEKQALRAACDNHEFNPNCAACMSHPWKKKLDEIESMCAELDTKKQHIVDDMIQHFGVVLRDPTLAKKAQEILKLMQELKLRTSTIERDNLLATAYKIWETDKQLLVNKQSQVNAARDKVNAQLLTATKDFNKFKATHSNLEQVAAMCTSLLTEWTSDIKQCVQDINDNTQALSVWNAWDKGHDATLLEVNTWKKLLTFENEQNAQVAARATHLLWKQQLADTDNQLTSNATKDLQLNEQLAKDSKDLDSLSTESLKSLANMNETSSLIKQYTQTSAYVEQIKLALADAKAWQDWDDQLVIYMNRVHVCKLLLELDDINTHISNAKQKEIINQQKSDISDALRVVDQYTKHQTICKDLLSLSEQKQSLIHQLQSLMQQQQNFNEVQATLHNLNTTCTALQSMSSTIKAIHTSLLEFKDRVLEDKVIPTIILHVNNLLAIMCMNHRPITLECAIDGKGGLTWFFKDGDNKPPFEKASGFQQFVICLAMRIMLGRLGVAGIKNTQLFIDEGFTACDIDNLNNVPDVLDELLSMYDSILIVSHLDDLKNGVKSFINIERYSNHLSSIKFGDTQSELSNNKKVGRPRKEKPF